MTPEMKEQVADVLEKAAAYIDAQEQEKTAAVRQERHAALDGLRGKYAAATGENISDSLLEKLANSDEDLLQLLEKVASKAPKMVEPDDLGEPAEDAEDGDRVYGSVKEAHDAKQKEVDGNFLNWIMS